MTTMTTTIPPPVMSEELRADLTFMGLPPVQPTSLNGKWQGRVDVWYNTQFRLPSGRLRPLCQLHHVCQDELGRWVLPGWYETLPILLKVCGIKASEVIFAPVLNTEPVLPNYRLSPMDVFGLKVARNHFPHWMQDMFWVIQAYDMLLGADNPAKPHIGQHCAHANASLCHPEPGHAARLQPGLLVQPDFKQSWINSFSELVFTPLGGRPLQNLVRHSAEAFQPTCFHSLLNMNMMYDTAPGGTFHADHAFYRSLNLSRAERIVRQGPRQPCAVQLTVLTRPANASRSLLGVAELEALLQHDLEEQRTLFPHLWSTTSVVWRHVLFDDIPLRDQIQEMQQADIVIAPHGAANINWMFLRPGSAVIEIFPFGYYPDMYRMLANTVDVHYNMTVAAPDEERFAYCMRRRGSVETKAQRQARDIVLRRWQAAALRFEDSPLGIDLQEKSVAEDIYPESRMCVRSQLLHIPVRRVADIIVDKVRTICQLDGDSLEDAAWQKSMSRRRRNRRGGLEEEY
eukprot:m.20612 g.20612  ORF g.20612 m.20612 type:complete len:514 (-) comp10588_c0_seq1:84-1625(-)